MMRKIVFAFAVYAVVLAALIAPLVGTAFALSTLVEPPVYSGQLIASYAMQDGSIVIVAHLEDTARLLVTHTDSDSMIQLARIDLRDMLGDIQTQVCGGRLHLTYEHGTQIEHVTVQVPGERLMYLPVVCNE
jgi:hypothetical protein